MNAKNVNLAKSFRKHPTEAEYLLWKHLCAKQLGGLKFRRQQPLGDYIVDFVCFQRRVVVEVDGEYHGMKKISDRKRDEWLKNQGFRVLRFWNLDVLQDVDGVLDQIGRACLSHPPVAPPVKGGENSLEAPSR